MADHATNDEDLGEEIAELALDPIWRQAAKEAVAEFQYGDIIPRDWLLEHLDIAEPQEKLTAKQHQVYAFEILSKTDGFKEEMLTRYQRYLVNIRSIGYKIIEPPHQTNAAMTRLSKDLRKAISQAMSAVVNINDKALTLEESQANADARAKLGTIASLHAKKLQFLKKPPTPDE